MTQLCELNHGKRNDTAMRIKPWEAYDTAMGIKPWET